MNDQQLVIRLDSKKSKSRSVSHPQLKRQIQKPPLQIRGHVGRHSDNERPRAHAPERIKQKRKRLDGDGRFPPRGIGRPQSKRDVQTGQVQRRQDAACLAPLREIVERRSQMRPYGSGGGILEGRAQMQCSHAVPGSGGRCSRQRADCMRAPCGERGAAVQHVERLVVAGAFSVSGRRSALAFHGRIALSRTYKVLQVSRKHARPRLCTCAVGGSLAVGRRLSSLETNRVSR